VSTRGAPVGVGTFAGLAVVAGWLNAAGLEQATIIDETPLVHHATATYVLGAVVVSAVAAEIGRRIGDEVARDVFDINRLAATGEIASLVRSARLSIAIQLPERIDDAAGYPPVDPSIKRDLAGRTVLVPRSATNRHFALDSRPASSAITVSATCRSRSEQTGPSSDSRSAALALESGRAFQREPSRWRSVPIRHRPQASAIRSRSGHPKRDSSRLAATGMVRATAGDVATITVDADAADRLADSGSSYRLTTRSEPPNDGDGLCSVLRAADETVRSVTVEDGGTLDNVFVGWLSGIVLVAVRDGEVIPFPDDNETLRDGDELSVLGTAGELASLPPNEASTMH